MRSKAALLSRVAILLLLLPAVTEAALNVFTCEPEWAALAKELGGDQLKIYSATTSQQDPHHIQARPSLIAKTRKADLLICTGAELEIGWLPLLLRKAGNARIQPGQPGYFIAAEHVDLLEKPDVLDRSLGDVHASGNPHIHTDPRNILRIADHLHRRLKQIDPEQADVYQHRYDEFQREWQDAINNWSERAATAKGVKIVVHHDYWSYLIDWLGLDRIATLEPMPGVSPSTRHLAKVKQLLSKQAVEMIVDTNYLNDRPVKWLADQSGLTVITLPASVDFQQGETLYDWFDRLVDLMLVPVT